MRLCENCGKPFYGQQEYFCCPQCAIEMKKKESKEANALLGKGYFNIHETIKEKVCEDCGAKYMGYPRSKRCPTCNVAAKKKRKKEYEERKKNGKSRVIGGTAYCEICGKPYIINSGKQVMCPACAAEQTRKRALDYYKKTRRRQIRGGKNRVVRRKRRWRKYAFVYAQLAGRYLRPIKRTEYIVPMLARMQRHLKPLICQQRSNTVRLKSRESIEKRKQKQARRELQRALPLHGYRKSCIYPKEQYEITKMGRRFLTKVVRQ